MSNAGETIGTQIKANANTYYSEIKNIYTELNRIKEYWNDIDNAAQINKFNEFTSELEELARLIDSCSSLQSGNITNN